MEEGPIFSIIVFSVIAIFVYIIVKLDERKKDDKRNNDELIDYSSYAQSELSDYMSNNKTASEFALDKQKKKILEDPKILKQAVENRQKEKEKKVYEKILEREREEKSKEYFEAIIDIFSTNIILPKQFIIERIEEKYNYNNFQAIELFISWNKFYLIKECIEKPSFFGIGYTLIHYNVKYRSLQKDGLICTGAESEPFKIWKKQRSKSNPKLLNEEDYEFKVKCDYSLLYKPNLIEKTNCYVVLSTRVSLNTERELKNLSKDNYDKSFLEILEISYKIVDPKNNFRCINEEFFNLSGTLSGRFGDDFLTFENSKSSQKALEEKWNRYDILMFVYHQINEFENVLTFNDGNTFNILSNNLFYSCSIEKSELDIFVNRIKKVSLKNLAYEFYTEFYKEEAKSFGPDEDRFSNPQKFNIVDLNNAIFSDKINMFSNANLLVKSILNCYKNILSENCKPVDNDNKNEEEIKKTIDILNKSELDKYLKKHNIILIKKKITKNPKYTTLYFVGICLIPEEEPLCQSDIKLYNNNGLNYLEYKVAQNAATDISDKFEIGQVFPDFAIQIIDVTIPPFVGFPSRKDINGNICLDETNLPIYRTRRLVTKDELVEQGHKILKISKTEPCAIVDDNLPF